jgi:hypothetical protein
MRLRITLVSVCLLGALIAAGAASARNINLVLDRGVVQSVSSGQVVLRALDGSTITITIGSKTRVFLNGDSAPLSSIQPGYVAGALHDGSRPAVYLRAVGRAPLVVDKGVIVALSSTSLTLRTSGGVVMITVGPGTSVLLNGQSANVGDLRPGYSAEIAHRGNEPALTIRALRGSRR